MAVCYVKLYKIIMIMSLVQYSLSFVVIYLLAVQFAALHQPYVIGFIGFIGFPRLFWFLGFPGFQKIAPVKLF